MTKQNVIENCHAYEISMFILFLVIDIFCHIFYSVEGKQIFPLQITKNREIWNQISKIWIKFERHFLLKQKNDETLPLKAQRI